ncbi:glycosyltransferase [Pseudomonas sp. BJa3]|uniref:glycosyltransferase n=1 Tax=Pseudomonas sp. BJa3 TaxID=2986525 RepID=UPI002265D565|nr:glycosyltransferase [Pseudomonas sp. BJa3]MCX5510534.1 glycosyltransferase [Pseudomonas sp. BJa3]
MICQIYTLEVHTMRRELFSKRPQPYYIYAPDYRRSSAGIRVLHMLCDALNRSGQEAYVTAAVLNPDLMTPRLSADIIARHDAQGLSPIVIYPEIIDGNPLNGNTVVRYLLNRPGFLHGQGLYDEDDILFSYTKPLLLPGMSDDRVLYLPGPDLTVFCPPADPAKRIPGKVCYYQGRSGQAPIDPALLPADAIEITSRWPQSWEELADLFQQCEYFYCTEASALAGEAALCGCLGVVIPNEWAPLKLESTAYGVAWGTEPAEIDRARSTNHLLRERLLKAQVDFWPALDHFIELTQKVAIKRAGRSDKHQLRGWLEGRVPTAVQQRLIDERLETRQGPSIAVLILDTENDGSRLLQTINSLGVEPNLYPAVRIIALTTGDIPFTPADAKLRFFGLDRERPLISIDHALREVVPDWFMVVEAGCTFTASGLLISALELQDAPACRAIYGDECVLQPTGEMSVALRPALNLDLLLSFPAANARHWLFNRKTWLELDGFREEAGVAYEFDYILRLIETGGFEGIGHVNEPILISDVRPLVDCPQEREVILRHLQTRGFQQGQVNSSLAGRYEIDYGICDGERVTILILLQNDSPGLIQRCLDSLLEKTSYPYYEVLLLVQDISDVALRNWVQGIEDMGVGGMRVLRFAPGLSCAQVRNMAAEHAQGDFLLWLDEGVAVLEPDWLHQLINHGSRQEVGAVSGKLIAPDQTIGLAGIVLGLNDSVGKAFEGLPMEAPGYLHRLQVDQNYAALSGKCLLLRKHLFVEMGGFDETPELQRWADIDLCLRLNRAGYLNVWAARVLLLLSESPGAKASSEELEALHERWLPLLAHDPAGNDNMSLKGKGFDLESEMSLSWRPLTWRPLPVVLAHPEGSESSSDYRVLQPFNALVRDGEIEGAVTGRLLNTVELERYAPDSIVLQRPVLEEQIEALRRSGKFSRAFKVVDLDAHFPSHIVNDAQAFEATLHSLHRGLAFADRLIVGTEALADIFSSVHGDVRVIENRLPPEHWSGLVSRRGMGRQPRVGLVGDIDNAGLLELISGVVKALAGTVEWVLLGECPPELRPYIHEIYALESVMHYPQALARLDLDLALAPLALGVLNECKGNQRLLEFGACGVPVVCSDVRAYQGGLAVTRVPNRAGEWVDAINMHLNDPAASAANGIQLKMQVLQEWMLDDRSLASWREAWLAG